ncbi:unnamed protein product [Notodromas monacha]|uniref:Peptidase S1 domain-containing protein n=1 Tax=Notodromas monacha TaxID=399045 RepID=A0A7R9GDB5_9CRUS|nr:unnamed protein product [Notodromas monacha]CAG0916997.1 unnamed protein product [Notodromas monacha]
MRRKFSKMFWVIVLIAFFDISRGSDQQNQGTDGIDSAVIINGIEVADRSDHAYMASMICLNLGRCGATLIAADMILSAAHCITIRSSGTLEKAPSCTIYLGGLVYYDGDVVRTVNSNRMMHHEDYTGLSPFKNDLSLLRIDAVSVTSQVAPIPLPQSGANFQGATVKIVGWGITETGINNCEDD